MKLKKVVFRYNRDIRAVPRKELIKNLENLRENYLSVLPEIKKQFRMDAFSNRGLGELDVRAKINSYIKILKRRKLTKKEVKMFRGFLEVQAKKVIPRNEKQFKVLAKQETEFEWEEYKKMADQIAPYSSDELEQLEEELGLTNEDIRQFLNSNRNVDLSHVTWDSDGLSAFEEDYLIDLPTARLLDYFGYDYAEYGRNGILVPKSEEE